MPWILQTLAIASTTASSGLEHNNCNPRTTRHLIRSMSLEAAIIRIKELRILLMAIFGGVHHFINISFVKNSVLSVHYIWLNNKRINYLNLTQECPASLIDGVASTIFSLPLPLLRF